VVKQLNDMYVENPMFTRCISYLHFLLHLYSVISRKSFASVFTSSGNDRTVSK